MPHIFSVHEDIPKSSKLPMVMSAMIVSFLFYLWFSYFGDVEPQGVYWDFSLAPYVHVTVDLYTFPICTYHFRHDSVIYSRLERPADSVHLHARSVPANLGRRVLRAYGPASRSKCVGRGSRFKCTGQWVFILAHGLVCISIFGCSQDVRNKLTKIVQLIIRSKRLGQPHVQSVWAERHLSSARANGSPY